MVNHDKNIIIRTEKLCKSFSTKNHSEHILKNIDLEIYERDFTVVMGASGSDKSTLLYMLSGMDRPSLGRVFFRFPVNPIMRYPTFEKITVDLYSNRLI